MTVMTPMPHAQPASSIGRPVSNAARPALPAIQVLRGVAAMLVVFHHAVGQMETRGGRSLWFDAGFGQAGVDLFFVISGFIMVYVTQDRPIRPLSFWRNRIVRIVPLYWFYTLLMAGIALAMPALLKTALFDPGHLVRSLMFVPAEHPRIAGMHWPVLVQGWTLNFEMAFYLLFGALLWMANPTARILSLSAAVLCMVVLGRVVQGDGPVWETYTSPLLLEFLAGALIGHGYVRGVRPSRAVALGCACAGLVLICASVVKPGWAPDRVVVYGLPALLIVIAALGPGRGQGLHGVWITLGDASYSIYLSHTFTLGAIGVVWSRVDSGLPMLAFAMAASAAVGVLSFWVLERPMTTWLMRRSRP